MQYPEGDKETVDTHPLFVSPCILSTSVFMMQECDNKVSAKISQQLIEGKII